MWLVETTKAFATEEQSLDYLDQNVPGQIHAAQASVPKAIGRAMSQEIRTAENRDDGRIRGRRCSGMFRKRRSPYAPSTPRPGSTWSRDCKSPKSSVAQFSWTLSSPGCEHADTALGDSVARHIRAEKAYSLPRHNARYRRRVQVADSSNSVAGIPKSALRSAMALMST